MTFFPKSYNKAWALSSAVSDPLLAEHTTQWLTDLGG